MENFLLDVQEYYSNKLNIVFKSDISSYIITKPVYLILIKTLKFQSIPKNNVLVNYIYNTTSINDLPNRTKYQLLLFENISQIDEELEFINDFNFDYDILEKNEKSKILAHSIWSSAAKMVFDASKQILILKDFEQEISNIIGFYSKSSKYSEGQFNLAGYDGRDNIESC